MQSLKIAVGTADHVSVCDHFARTAAVVVLDIEDGRIASREVRERGTDGCGSHRSFLDLLEGCSAVICGGISDGMESLLAAHGITSVVAAGKHSIEDAVALHLSGKLPTTTDRVCLCH